MIRLLGTTLLLSVCGPLWGAIGPLVCPAGAPIGSVDLRVRQANNGSALPLKTINRLEEGDTILYRPLLRSTERRKGEVALVLVPAVKRPEQENLWVLEPKPADEPQEWKVPARAAVAAFVYGPSGLNEKKVRRFLSQDDELVAQLADYAEKTAQTEALIAALSSDTASADTVNSAFQGFASQYGNTAQLDKTQPTNQQMTALFRNLNPAMATYDPISPEPSQRIGQTASLATSVAALFFGSPVGLAAGGTAMLLEMRSMAFPNTIFRSSFAEKLPDDGLGLCGKHDAVPAHTKVAYLWATRVPNIGPPHVQISKELSIPVGLKAPVPVEMKADAEWKNLDRARKWTLESEDHHAIPVAVHPIGEPKGLEIDLTKAVVPPGTYHLTAQWDWDKFEVNGNVPVAAQGTFEKARLLAESQDRLIAKTGRVPVTLDNADFEFVTKVELAKPGDKFFTPVAVPFVLPRGFREGIQERMDVQVNTADLDAGDYRLMLTQVDGKAHPVKIAILPTPPKIGDLPILINHGDAKREITMKGQGLELITKMEGKDVKVTLGPPASDGTSRSLTAEIDPAAKTGDSFDLQAHVKDRTEPIALARAVQVIGPRPKIIDSKLSLPPGVDVSLLAGELPSGYYLSALLQVKDLPANSAMTLGCRGDDQSRRVLRLGTRSSEGSVQQLGPDQLFVTFDDAAFPNGCELTATAEDAAGAAESDAYPLGRIVRIPKIESVQLEAEPAGSEQVDATVTGHDLETIDRTGWDPDHGTPIAELPTPIPGEGDKQVLRITLPTGPAAPDAPLYVWLRGESAGRASTVKPLSVPKPDPVKSKPGLTAKSGR